MGGVAYLVDQRLFQPPREGVGFTYLLPVPIPRLATSAYTPAAEAEGFEPSKPS